MNTQQLSRIKLLTSSLSKYYEHLTFSVEVIDDLNGKPVMVTASNIGAPWYVEHQFFLAFVGPKGGVKVREGTKLMRRVA